MRTSVEQINKIYRELLGRDADASGLKFWSQFDINTIRGGIQGSEEFRRRQAALSAASQQTPSAAPRQTPPTVYKPFTQVLPFEKVFNENLVRGLAESQINPEIQRAYNQERAALQRNQAQTGLFRTGLGINQGRNLADSFERQRKEQVESFKGQMKDWANQWYTRQMEAYGKNPSRFVMPELPSFEQYMKQNPRLAGTYQNMTNVNNVPKFETYI